MPSILNLSSRANIAVIGCGGVGARHLQSLALLGRTVHVHAVDPSPASLERARVFFDEWAQARGDDVPRLTTVTDSTALPGHLDVVVIATRAHHRLEALRKLLPGRKVRHLVLEKFLFARRPEFEQAVELINTSGVGATVVNCPRRIYPGYRAIADQLAGASYVDVRVSASARLAPLGSIGIHFVDLLDFLCTGEGPVRCSPVEGGRLTEGNRQLRDIAGRVHLAINGRTLGTMTIDAVTETTQPLWITIDSDRGRFVVIEGAGTCLRLTPEEDWAWRQVAFPVPFQSALTHVVVDKLLQGEDSGLTPLMRSIAHHIPLFDSLMASYQKSENNLSLQAIPFT
jgi:predicted dehydrogenase